VLLFITGCGLLHTNLQAGGTEIKNSIEPLKGEWDFRPEKVWEVFEAGDDVLVGVRRIRVDKDGKVFVFDRKHYKFFVFSPEGKFLYSFGKKGEGPGEYKSAGNFFLEGKYVIVSDYGKLHYFTKDGKFSKSVNLKGMHFVRGFIDENRFAIVKEGEPKSGKPDVLELFDVSTDKRTTIKEVQAEEVMVASSGGMTLAIKDINTSPMIVVGIHGESIFFGKNDKYRIHKTDLKGNTLLSFSLEGRKRKEITDAFKRKRFERISLNGGKIPEDMIKKLMKSMPDYCTFFMAVQVDKSGLIYVYVTDMMNDTGQEIDIFSAEGKYLYHAVFTLPEGLKTDIPLDFVGDHLYVFAEDEEGEGKLVKFRVAKPSL
jgi:hypothetical protein